jgi:hypothetical protein
MKIISHKLAIDETTFSPELEIVVRLSMEPTQDQMTVDAQFFEKFGRDFFSLLEQHRKT